MVGFTLGGTQTCIQGVESSSSKDPCMDFLTTSNLIKDTRMPINLTLTNITLILVGILVAQIQDHHAYMEAG